jgi:hypothetical protein
VAPAGPAGPGTGTVTIAAGVTTVGRSHALKANAANTAENTIEYFMNIPFDCLTKTATWTDLRAPGDAGMNICHIGAPLCSPARITAILRSPARSMDGSTPAPIQKDPAYVCWRTEHPRTPRNTVAAPASYFFLLPEVDWRVQALGSCS